VPLYNAAKRKANGSPLGNGYSGARINEEKGIAKLLGKHHRCRHASAVRDPDHPLEISEKAIKAF